DRFKAEGPQVRNAELQASQRRGAEVPEREQLRTLVREVRAAAAGLGRDAFESGLADAGIEFRANVASTGRMNGYSFTLPGWTDPAGEQVWVTASKVARDLRWAELGRVLGDGSVSAHRAAAATLTSPTVEAAAEVEAAEDIQLPSQRLVELTELLRQGRIERGTALPEDHPAFSTDPARRIFEQYVARARGEEVPEQPSIPVRPELPAPPVPRFDDKRRRPYGKLSHDKLAKAIRDSEKALAAHLKAKASAEETMRRADARVTGQVTGGDAETRLLARKAKLEAAEPHLIEAERQRALVKSADDALAADRKIWREADQLKRLGKVALWRQGTSRKEQEQRAAEAGERIHENVERRTTAMQRWTDADRQAVEVAGTREPARELNTLRANWDQGLRMARADDQAVAVSTREAARYRATSSGDAARKAEQRLDGLRTEAQVRQDMTPAQRTAEGKARTQAAQTPATKKAAAKKAEPGRRSYGKGAAYEQPYHLRHPQPPEPKGPGMDR
ncbi:hypothetical protein ACWDD4_42455, partial [Streptomyces sp. NPDC001205]